MNITIKDLEARVIYLNMLTKWSPELLVDGVTQPGTFHLNETYGGIKLCRNHPAAIGGEVDIFNQGFMTKKQLYNLIDSYVEGILLGMKLDIK